MDSPRRDTSLLTIGAVAICAYVLANLLHEGVGHGGGCLLGHGHPRRLASIFFECDEAGMTDGAVRLKTAGGTLVNALSGLTAFAALKMGRDRLDPVLRYFLWLFSAVSFTQGAGYFMFSGLMGVGDWVRVIEGGGVPARIGLAVIGALVYFWLLPRILVPELEPFLGAEPTVRKLRRSRVLLFPYLVGSTAFVVSGALNPTGWYLVLISATAAGFGGTSLLAWIGNTLEKPKPSTDAAALALPARPWLWAVAATVLVCFIALGRGIRLG